MVSKKVLCYLLFMHDLEIIYKDLESLSTRLESNLLTHLLKFGPRGNDKEVYKYSLLPAGKLFRPMLCALSYLEEMNKSKVLSEFFMPSKDISLYASFLEIHHVYTLIHDDLPAMDNDNFRRGRLANHIKFNEWKALLAGDGMSILGFQLLSQLKANVALDLIKIATKYTGCNGLIYGQYLDLSGSIKNSFNNVRTTHLLKTARLIQLSLIGGQVIANDKISDKTKFYWKFGESIGLTFQFLDDLDDLRDENNHEQEINPWRKFKTECISELETCLNFSRDFLKNRPLLRSYFQSYLYKNAKSLESNKDLYLKLGFKNKELLNILSGLDLVRDH